MPDYLAIEWGRTGVRGLDAEVTGDSVRVRSSFTHAWPAELDARHDFEGIGRWLKSQCRELVGGDRRLIVLVSREDVAMRLLALPEADDEALPALVRYQMGARSSVPLDQLAFDYLPLGLAPPQGGRWVQSASLPKRLLHGIRTCAEVAEWDLCSVGVTAVARGEAIARAERLRGLPADGRRLVVCVVGEQLEVTLWRGADLLFSHVSRATGADAALVEVQRALMSHETVSGKDAIARVWLIAPPDSGAKLHSLLATHFGCELIDFEPSRDVPVAGMTVDASPYVAMLGSVLASVQATVPVIDFLNPRRPKVKPARTKMIAAIAVGALLLLFSAAYSASRLYLNSLDARIAEKEQLIRQQDRSLQQGEPTRETLATLSAWDSRRVDWLGEMQRIGAEMPGTDRLYLNSWRFDLATGAALGTTAATGFARQRQDVEQLTRRLAEQAGLRIRPNPIDSAERDPEYPILLQLDAEVVSQSQRSARNESE